jgi:hypothetical protein
MSLNILDLPERNSARLHPVESRYAPLFCFGLLTAACALASFVLLARRRLRLSP